MKRFEHRILKIPYIPDKNFGINTSIEFDISGVDGFELKFVMPVNELQPGRIINQFEQKTFFLCFFIKKLTLFEIFLRVIKYKL